MRLRRLAPRVALAAASLLLGVVAVEFVGRAIGLWRPDRAFRHNPVRGYELTPGVGDVNSLGLRGPEIALKPAPGVRRIIVLGDSFTYGDGVAASDALPAQLERQLNRTGPEPERFEVLNLGVPGYNAAQELAYFADVGVRLTPDLVIVAFTLSDADLGTFGTHGVPHPLLMRAKEFIKAHFGLYDFVRLQVRAAQARSFRNDPATAVWPEMYPLTLAARGQANPGWEQCERALRGIATDCRRAGIPMLLVIWPVLERLNDYAYLQLHEFVRAQAQALGMPVLDLYPSFAGGDSNQLCVSKKNPHPNATAHRLAARTLADYLQATPGLLRAMK